MEARPAPSVGGFCASVFPNIWKSFLETFTDTVIARGPVASRPEYMSPNVSPPVPPVHIPQDGRLVAIGDLHGDLEKARRAFRLAGVLDDNDRWAGGKTIAVQVGDILDRGDQELEIFYLLERLKKEAVVAGGALHVLNGNHETMNVSGQFRYVTPGAFDAFKEWGKQAALEMALSIKCGVCESYLSRPEIQKILSLWHSDGRTTRKFALNPGSGPISRRFISPNPAVLQVGSTVFCHGGLLPEHVYDVGTDRINLETHGWISDGMPESKPKFLSGRDAVVWSRHYSFEDHSRCDCEKLEHALKGLPGAMRMVVGHTIQQAGINAACGGKVLRIDVGLSQGCGDGNAEVLEISKDGHTRIIRHEADKKTSSNDIGANEVRRGSSVLIHHRDGATAA